jgi:hypothetical protein
MRFPSIWLLAALDPSRMEGGRRVHARALAGTSRSARLTQRSCETGFLPKAEGPAPSQPPHRCSQVLSANLLGYGRTSHNFTSAMLRALLLSADIPGVNVLLSPLVLNDAACC